MSNGGIDESYRLSRILDKIGTSDDSRRLLNALLTCDVETLYADARAVELLKNWVTPEEWEQLKKTGYVTFNSSVIPGVKFKIGNSVYAVEGDKEIFGCIVEGSYRLPYRDNILVRIIGFKRNERLFIKTTNWFFGDVNSGQFYGFVKGEKKPHTNANPNQYPMDGNAIQNLQMRKDVVNLARVGMVSTIPTSRGFPQMLSDTCIKYGIAQALIDNITNREDMLCVRGFLPEHDFIDGDGQRVHGWRQGPYIAGRNKVYQTTREGTNNDRKVYILYGARNLKPLYTTTAYGMEVKGGSLLQGVQEMYIQRAHVKTIDIIDISGLQSGEAIWFRTPILFKKHDSIVIQFNVPPEHFGMTDNIQLLGLVVESLGSTMTG